VDLQPGAQKISPMFGLILMFTIAFAASLTYCSALVVRDTPRTFRCSRHLRL
jgi:hypothetical protein